MAKRRSTRAKPAGARTPPPVQTSPKVARSIAELLDALDDHLYLLRVNLRDHNAGEPAHLRVIAAELRVLVCMSGGTEGLIYRLADRLGVTDDVELDLPPKFTRADPANKMQYIPLFLSIRHPEPVFDFLLRANYSLKEVLKGRVAIVMGQNLLTYDVVIKNVAQQIGTAHEDDAISADLMDMRNFFMRNRGMHDDILCKVAELALIIGDRVLDKACVAIGYTIKSRATLVQGADRP
jgi:hypothetical protein